MLNMRDYIDLEYLTAWAILILLYLVLSLIIEPPSIHTITQVIM